MQESLHHWINITLIEEMKIMSKCIIIMIISLLISNNIHLAIDTSKKVSSKDDQINWSIQMPIVKQQVKKEEPMDYNYEETLSIIEKALNCDKTSAEMIACQLEIAGIYGVQEAYLIEDKSHQTDISMNFIIKKGDKRRALMTADYVFQYILDAETLECVFFFAY